MILGIDFAMLITLTAILILGAWVYKIVMEEMDKMEEDETYKVRKRRFIIPGILALLFVTSPFHVKTSGETTAVLQSYTQPFVNEESIEIRRHQPRIYTPPDNQEEIERLMKRDFNAQTETEVEEK